MARQGLEAVGEVLHRRGEGKAAELRKAAPANRGPKTEEAELAEALPSRHGTLVLLESIVPRLCRAAEVIRGKPGPLRSKCALPAEELVALVEPVEGILRAIISRVGD